MTIPATVSVPPNPTLRGATSTPTLTGDEGDFAGAMHRAVLATLGGTTSGSRGAPVMDHAPDSPSPDAPDADGVPLPTGTPLLEPEVTTAANPERGVARPQVDAEAEAEIAELERMPGPGPSLEAPRPRVTPVPQEALPPVSLRAAPSQPRTADAPAEASTRADAATGTREGTRREGNIADRADPARGRSEAPMAPAHTPVRGRVGPDLEALPDDPGAPAPDTVIVPSPGPQRPGQSRRTTLERTEPDPLPVEGVTPDPSLSPETSLSAVPAEDSRSPGMAAGIVLPLPSRDGPSLPDTTAREGKRTTPSLTRGHNGLSQHVLEPGTVRSSTPAAAPASAPAEPPLAASAFSGTHTPGPDRAPRPPDAQADGRTSQPEFTFRDTPHLNLRPLTDLGLSSARAVVTAWWEGSASPRRGAMSPAATARSPAPSRRIFSAEIAVGESPASAETLPVVIDPPGPIETSTGPGAPFPSLVVSTLEGGRSDSSLLSGARPGAANPEATPLPGFQGDQMALTLRQEDGTAVTIRVLVRGDRVEATIIDRGPPQVPVGSRETAALHQALERQGFREVQVMVQHIPPGTREHDIPSPSSRRTTDSPQDRQQHSRRQDDEGTHSQGRSHQRSPRERER